MTQSLEIPELKTISPVLEAADHLLKDAFNRLRQDFEEKTQQFISGMESSLASPSVDPGLSAEDGLCTAWSAMDTWLKKLPEWMDFSRYPDLRKTLIQEGQSRLESIAAKLPRKDVLGWPSSFFQIAREDALSMATFKHIKRMGMGLGSIMNRNPKNSSLTHVIYTRHATQSLVIMPFYTFYSTAIDRMLSCMTRFLFQMHELCCGNTQACLALGRISGERTLQDMVEGLAESKWPEYPSARAMNREFATLWLEIRADFKAFQSDVIRAWRHAISFSGTWVYPHRSYGHRRFQRLLKKFNRSDSVAHGLWKTHFQGEIKDWTHDIALCRIQLQVAERTFQALGSVNEKISSQIIPQCDKAIETLMKTKERLVSWENLEEKVSKKNMLQECRSLLKRLGKELLPAIAQQVLTSGIGQDLSTIYRLASERAGGLAETHSVFRSRDTHIPPKSELVDIPIRELFTVEFLTRLEAELGAFQHKLRVKLDETVNGMSDIRQSVEFNLESSFALLDKEQDTANAYQMVIEGIERSIMQLKTLMDTILGLPESIGTDLIAIAGGWITGIQRILDNDKLIALKLKLARAKAQGRMKKAGSDVISHMVNAWKTARAKSVLWYGKGRGKIDEFKSYLGITPPDEDVQIQFTQFLLDTQHKLNELPFVYQQLFQMEPLEDDRLFQGRVDDLKALTEDMMALADAKEVLSVVVGEKGSGKTTLINMMRLGLPKDWHVHALTLPHTLVNSCDLISLFEPLRPQKPFSCLDDLESFLMSDDARPSILIMENIQNLFLKTMEGFNLLENMLMMINRTRGKVAWICSCSLYGWEYLDKAMGISGYFKRIHKLQPFSREGIESMIMARHRVTGYQLKFLVSRKIRLSRPFRKLPTDAERQAYLKKIFFEQIQSIASGNISVAILFWLRSIESIKGHELTLSSQVNFNVTFLSQISMDDRFTLGAIVQHESLTIDDHALIFRQPQQKSKQALLNLAQSGILQDMNGAFRIHPFLYRYVVRSLKLQNILH